ncbi:MAG: hypothetical protein HC852_11170 [Acaryochloridaceae cyanobacterium RU_4_10]|nr:hypothetical protein [Acaryochloridaceae cyanobacterium RU_4_10]
MNRDIWEKQFIRQLKQQLGLEPGQIRFPWRGYYNQRYSVEGAIAYLKQTHELYPSLGILPVTQNEALIQPWSLRV